MKKKIVLIVLQVLLAAGAIGLIYWLSVIIATPIMFEDELATRKSAVIERIKDIRTAERQFKAKHQRFTANFDSLISRQVNTGNSCHVITPPSIFAKRKWRVSAS